MRGVIEIDEKKDSGELKEAEFFFKREDVRNFYVFESMITVFLNGYGSIDIKYDVQLLEKLESLFDA